MLLSNVESSNTSPAGPEASFIVESVESRQSICALQWLFTCSSCARVLLLPCDEEQAVKLTCKSESKSA
jgi:hypothetical protein